MAWIVGPIAVGFGLVAVVVASYGLVFNYSVATDIALLPTTFYAACCSVSGRVYIWVAQSYESVEIADEDLSQPVSQTRTNKSI